MDSNPVENPVTPPPAVAEPSPPVAARVRYCRSCGAPQEPDWTECAPCAHRSRPPGGSGLPIAGVAEDEGRPVTSALALYFAFLACSLVGIVVLLVSEDPALVAPVELTIALIDAAIVLIWTGRSWRDISPFLKGPSNPLWYLLAMVGALATFVVASVVVDAVSLLGELPEILYAEPLLEAGYGWLGVILLVCVQPAVIEELAFRGVILSGMQRVMATRDAIIVSALLFMIIHLSPLSFPHLVLIGLVLGWMRQRTGSLYPGMVLHFAHNGLVLFSEQYPGLMPWS